MPARASVAIRTLFAPFDPVEDEFISFLNGATRSLHTLIYGWHLPKMTDILIAKVQAGLEVSIILDHTQAGGKAEASEVQRLVDAKVPMLIGTSPIHHQILHTKATVVDARSVEFGSWNYSLSASQQSNTLTFIDDQGYAADFLRHFDRIRSFIVLHEMAMQLKGEVIAPTILPVTTIAPAEAAQAA